jgi:hypothetical protein
MGVKKLLEQQDAGFISPNELLSKMTKAGAGCTMQEAAIVLCRLLLLSDTDRGKRPGLQSKTHSHGTLNIAEVSGSSVIKLLRHVADSDSFESKTLDSHVNSSHEYYGDGFKTDQVAAFLSQYGIHIDVDDPGVDQPVNPPEWALKYRGLKSFTMDSAARIMTGADPSFSGFLTDDGQAEFFVAMQLLEQAIDGGNLQTGKDKNGNATVFDSEIRTWCRSIGRVWCIPAIDPVPFPTTDAALLENWRELNRKNAELEYQLKNMHGERDDREELRQRADALIKDVARLEGEKAALQVELKDFRADALVGKNKTTLLTLAGGLAIAGFGMDIHAPRLNGIEEMLRDLYEKNVSMTAVTLRHQLKAAAELIPKRK